MASTYPMIYVGSSSGSVSALPLDPSEMTVGLQDISSSNAGRTQSGTMKKCKIATKRTIDLTWNNITAAKVATILQAFADEYFYVEYPDPKTNSMQTREFYCGDISAALLWYKVTSKGTRYGTLSFQIIEV